MRIAIWIIKTFFNLKLMRQLQSLPIKCFNCNIIKSSELLKDIQLGLVHVNCIFFLTNISYIILCPFFLIQKTMGETFQSPYRPSKCFNFLSHILDTPLSLQGTLSILKALYNSQESPWSFLRSVHSSSFKLFIVLL